MWAPAPGFATISMISPLMGDATEPSTPGSARSRAARLLAAAPEVADSCRSSTSTMRGTPLVSKNTSLREAS